MCRPNCHMEHVRPPNSSAAQAVYLVAKNGFLSAFLGESEYIEVLCNIDGWLRNDGLFTVEEMNSLFYDILD